MVTYLVVEIKKKSILCAVDEMKIVIYECLAHFFFYSSIIIELWVDYSFLNT